MFDRYDIPDVESDDDAVLGSLQTKALIAVIRPRSADKAVDRCEMQFIDGADEGEEAGGEEDTLESRLVIKLHCKHGVTKTHRIALTHASRAAPELSDNAPNRLTIGAKAVKEILEHFPAARSTKSDPQLSWEFDVTEVRVKTRANGLEKVSELSTELSIDSDSFDSYNIPGAPLMVAFPLREFTATTSLSEALLTTLEFSLMGPGRPLELKLNHKFMTVLCLVSTCVVTAGTGTAQGTQQSVLGTAKRSRSEPEPHREVKRQVSILSRAETQATPSSSRAASMALPASFAQSYGPNGYENGHGMDFGGGDDDDQNGNESNNPASLLSFDPDRSGVFHSTPRPPTQPQATSTPIAGARNRIPLFLPDLDASQSQASLRFTPPPPQMTQQERDVLRESGLGGMSAAEVAAMMRELDDDDVLDDDAPVPSTQSTASVDKDFMPLFDD